MPTPVDATAAPPEPPAAPTAGALRELALLFLRLGTTAFGGPPAHIAMMEDEVVRRRAWLTRAEFLDLVGAVNLIPGPNSTELAIHIGHRRAGWAGLLVAGACFIVPAMGLVTLIAWAYARFGKLPAVAGILVGVKPVLIAVVGQALWGFARTAVKSLPLLLLGLLALGASLLGAHELLILLAAGLGMLAVRWLQDRGAGRLGSLLPLLPPLSLPLPLTDAGIPPAGLGRLFLFFVKVGSVLFGSGYVLLAFLRADLVDRWHWLTQAQLLDAVAVGQFTPGPVFTTATFIGYLLCGLPGAVVATVGIFAPAFVFVALSAQLVPRLRRSPLAGAALDGVNVASLALMAATAWQLGRSAIFSAPTLGLAVVSLVLLWRLRVNSAWLVLGGGVLGWLARGWL
jgi:chromate transporter